MMTMRWIRWGARLSWAIIGMCAATLGVAQQVSGDRPAIVGGQRWAIVVGAGAYEKFSKLSYSVKDAKRFAALLTSKYGFADDNVRLLTDDADAAHTPTAGHILGELADLLQDKRLDKSDLFIFYFSGHGMGLRSGDYLAPLDARASTIEQLGTPVKKVVAQLAAAGLKNVLIVTDACRSGQENPFGSELKALADQANIAVMLGCAPGQQSREDSSLKSGVFSHFLMQELDSAEGRDGATGALWARPLAQRVSDAVYAYSERDNGAAAQRPVAWTDDSRDILLGVFPKEAGGDAALKRFVTTASALSKDKFIAALNEYATRLFELDDVVGAAEAFRTIDQLGDLPDDSRYVYAVCLDLLGRAEESDRVVRKFANAPESEYYKNLAIASSSTGGFSTQERLAAIQRAWELQPSWSVGNIRWNLLKYDGPLDQKVSFLNELITFERDHKRRSVFLSGELASVERRWDDAIKLYGQAIKEPGDDPSNYLVLHSIHVTLVEKGDPKAVETFLKAHAKEPEKGYVWSILYGIFLANADRMDDSIAALKQGVDGPIDPHYLWVAVRTAGARAGELAPGVTMRAKELSRSWQAELAGAMSQGVATGGFSAAFDAYEKLKAKYGANPEFSFESISFLNKLVAADVAASKLTAEGAQQFYQNASGELTRFADRLEQDASFWNLFITLALQGERNASLVQTIDRLLNPTEKLASIRPDLRALLVMAYLNGGRPRTAEMIVKANLFDSKDSEAAKLLMAAQYAIEGNVASGTALLPKRAAVVPALQSLRDAVDGLLRAKAGQLAEAKAIAKKLESTTDLQTQPIVGLIYDALNMREAAEPFLQASRSDRAWGFAYGHFEAVRRLFELAIADKEFDFADTLAWECAATQPGNPAFERIHFGLKVELAQYAGALSFDVNGNSDWRQAFAGKLTLIIDAAGKVSGVFTGQDATNASLTGSIDPYGNLSAKSTLSGVELSVLAKVPTAHALETQTVFQEIGWIVQLSKADGTRAIWLCKPAKAGS